MLEKDLAVVYDCFFTWTRQTRLGKDLVMLPSIRINECKLHGIENLDLCCHTAYGSKLKQMKLEKLK